MIMGVWIGLCLPFLGTSLGAACVFCLRRNASGKLQRFFIGFAGGVMVAASVWSLIIPAMEMREEMGRLRFLPAFVGFALGIVFLLAMDSLVPHLHVGQEQPEGRRSKLGKTAMLMLAVTIHNFPEGAAIGAILAGALHEESGVTMAAAILLAIGIAIQNFPEGAIISLPYRAEGRSRITSFGLGVLSGVVEPIGAGITILLASVMTPLLPYLLAFAAGAMIYVVVEELIPEANEGKDNNLGTIAFAVGFVLMMTLDVMLG